MGQLQERITSTRKGSVTSMQAIYVPADDLTDPAPASVFAHLNATTTLSRAISEKGIYPAVDPLDSTSTILKPDIVGEEHFDVANRGQGDPAALQGAAGHHRDPRHRRALRRGQADRAARAQDRALPVAAVLRRRAVHRHARASTCRSPRRSAASRRSSRASTTTCRSGLPPEGRDRRGRRERRRARRHVARTTFPVEVLTPEGEVFNDEVEMVSTRTRWARSACWPTTSRCSAMLEPTELRLYRARPTSCASRRARATCRWRQPRARARRGGVEPDDLDRADLRDAPEARRATQPSAPRRAPRSAPARERDQAATRRSCGSARASGPPC